jgi:solute carrier family 34 (sodium-dependent phosphate cotransporter)
VADQDTNKEDDELSVLASLAGTLSENNYDPDVLLDASWREVFSNCCVHSCEEWIQITLGSTGILFFLYFFIFALELLAQSAKVLGGCAAGAMFGEGTNPVADVVMGLWVTALIQSSSTTTSIIVSLTGSIISVEQSIYMIMGAKYVYIAWARLESIDLLDMSSLEITQAFLTGHCIPRSDFVRVLIRSVGTTVTNTIVAMGQMRDGDQLERAFAGATVHDIFNGLTLIVLFPLEVLTGYLEALTAAMVKHASTTAGESWAGPIKGIVAPLAAKVIIANKALVTAVANDEKSCADFYPIQCDDGIISYHTCTPGLIACDKTTGHCPAFFDINATQGDDQIAGGVCFFLAICILFCCLTGLVFILQKMLLGISTRIIYKATSLNGYLGIAVGCGVTVLVQSSSITTSVLTPFVGMFDECGPVHPSNMHWQHTLKAYFSLFRCLQTGLGVLRLEQMYPLTLGANIGTPVTALMAAMVTEGTEALQAALAHLFFNVTGIVIWYPIPFMRLPIVGARILGKATRLWRGFPALYIFVFFFAFPGVLLGISYLFEQGKKGWTVLASFLTVVLGFGMLCFCCWLKFRGQDYVTTCFRKREKHRATMESLPEDMEFLKAQVMALIDHTGMPDADEDDSSTEDGRTEDNVPHEVISVDVDEVSDEINKAYMTEIIKEDDRNEIQI